MYQALYRVWRPKTFSDMVGQKNIVRILRSQVQSGRIAHAYLFCGSRGTGKTSTARIMARAINCEQPVNGDPCGVCPACQMLLSDQSFDVFEMDAASNSRVEEIRELLEKVDYPPQYVKYKVYIIDEVHMLSNSAFNALLKMLEEPPSYMVFILATTEPQKLPATILSRCQRFDFGRFSEADLISRLQEVVEGTGTTAEEGALALIAQAAEGGMRDALSILDMCLGTGGAVTEEAVREALGTADKGFMFTFADVLAQKDGAGALRLTDELMRSGRDVQVFLRDLAAHLRALITARLCGEDAQLLGSTGETAARYALQAKGFTSGHLMRCIELVMHAQADTRWAASARTVLEVCALRCCETAEAQDISALVERVAELEKELSALKSGAVTVQSAPAQKAAPAEKTAPQPAAPQAPVVPGSKTPKDIWNESLKTLKRSDPSLYGGLSQGSFGGYKDGAYRILYDPKSEFYVSMLNTPTRKERIEQVLQETGGTAARFEAMVKQEIARPEDEERAENTLNSLVETFGRDKIQLMGD